MKKTIVLFACVVLMALMSSCGGSSYDSARCDALVEKVKSGSELSQEDYSQMIGQCSAILDVYEAKIKEIGDSPEKLIAAIADKEMQSIDKQYNTMKRALKKADLDESNKAAYDEFLKKQEKYEAGVKELIGF